MNPTLFFGHRGATVAVAAALFLVAGCDDPVAPVDAGMCACEQPSGTDAQDATPLTDAAVDAEPATSDASQTTPPSLSCPPPDDDDAGLSAAELAAGVRIIDVDTGAWVFKTRVAGPEDGEPVILLHGFPQTSYMWRYQIRALADAGYRVYAPDQRGYSPGARPLLPTDYQVLFLLDDIRSIARAVGAEKFHLVSHDWGAILAWTLAISDPDLLASLTAISVPHPDATAAARASGSGCQNQATSYFDLITDLRAHEWFLVGNATLLRGMFEDLPEEPKQQYISTLQQRDAMSAAIDWYRANIPFVQLSQPFSDILSPLLGTLVDTNIDVPTLYVWSDEDDVVCRETADLCKDYVDADYTFVALSGIGHWVAETAPAEVNDALLKHLAAHPM